MAVNFTMFTPLQITFKVCNTVWTVYRLYAEMRELRDICSEPSALGLLASRARKGPEIKNRPTNHAEYLVYIL